MIKKLILTTVLVIGVVHGSADHISSADPILTMNEKTKYAVWNPSIAEKASGGSCEDGNCIGNLNSMTKDGKVYKFLTSLRDKVKNSVN